MRRLLRAATLTPALAAALAAQVATAPAARAEVIAVRTGEHDGFTRVVLPLAEPAEGWAFGRLDDGYQLRLGRGGVTFDLSGVFDKIRKERLAAISGDDAAGTLTLRLGCACHVEAFAFRDTRLVIDIRPGPAPANSPFEKALPAETPPRTRSGSAVAGFPATPPVKARLTPEAEPRTAEAPAPPPAPAAAPAPSYDWRQALPAPMPATPQPKIDVPPPPDPEIASARAALLQQLYRAGTQGLIDVDPRKLGLPKPAGAEEEHPAPEAHDTHEAPKDGHAAAPKAHGESHAGSEKTPGKADEGLGLRARTVLDRDGEAPADPGLSARGGDCPPDEAFAIESWASDDPPYKQIAAGRVALLGEFDRPVAGAADALVHTYLHFGFGAEARNVLAAFPQAGGEEREILLAMSAIIDDERPELSNRLSGLAACTGRAALWSMLAVPPPAPGGPVDTGAVRRNFSGLPLHLRRMLGPRLSANFLKLGDSETARALRDAITRAAGTASPEIQLLDARIDVAEGHPERAEAAMAPVLAADTPATAEAMVLLIETRAKLGQPIDPRRIEAVAALAYERRGTPMAARLTHAQALALAANGRFHEAFALNGKNHEGAKQLWRMLATRGDDEALLQTALQAPDPALDAVTRLEIADRLLGLGFAEAATAWMDAAPVPDADRQLRLARAALIRRDGPAALQALGETATPEAQAMRARALSLSGAHQKAAQLYAKLGETDRQGAEAWRAGDWTMAKETGTADQKKALTLPPQPPETEAAAAPLAYNRALVEASREARAALNALLDDTAPPAPASAPDGTAAPAGAAAEAPPTN